MEHPKKQTVQDSPIKEGNRKPYRRPSMNSEKLFEANVLGCGKTPSICIPGHGQGPVKYT